MIRTVPAWIYQQYDADYSLEHPGQGYGGWQKLDIPIDTEHTAVIVMHAWECGTPETHPALHRVCEYVPRGREIIRERFPGFLEKVRASDVRLLHVGSRTEASLESLPGYIRTKAACPPEDWQTQIEEDETLKTLRRIHLDRGLYGHNAAQVAEENRTRDFAIMPADDEDVAATTGQLLMLCRKYGISHLIYTGFAVNACLTLSPCGWVDMTRAGVMCSVIRDLTTAVENRESCAEERNKEYGLWAFSLWGGFVFDRADVENALLLPKEC